MIVILYKISYFVLNNKHFNKLFFCLLTEIPQCTVNRVRDRGGILLLALFSGQVKDIADSPTPIASYVASWFLAIGGTPKFKRLLIFRRR
jgi:hypothetical protein